MAARIVNTKRTRRLSVPCQASQAIEDDGQPEHLTVQGLTPNRRTRHISLAGFGNPNAVKIASAPKVSVVEDNVMPEQPEDYMRYLSNLSTVTVTKGGREFCNVPAYLRQFELSRRGTMENTITRPVVVRRRRVSVAEQEAEPDQQQPQRQPSPTPAPPEMEKKQNKIKKAIVAVMSRHRMVGLRHIILALVLALYAIGGMFLFFAIEAPYERKNVEETREALNEAFEILASDLEVAATIPNANMSSLLKKAYLTLIKIDGKYTGSTFYKLEERDYPLWTWTYGTAFFFSFTLYSTVGYGSISPSTDWGRVATIFYTAIGFPMALVIIRDIGSVLLVYLTRMYARVVIKIRTAGGYASNGSPNECIMLPMKVALFLSFVYALITALFIMNYDAWLGPEPGLDLFHSFYFTFLSYAAVGLGDIMPVNYAHAPIVAIVLLSGMPLMRVINRVLYVGIENGMYGSVEFVEHSIDRIAPEKIVEEEVITVAGDVEFGPKGDSLSTLDENNSEEEEEEDDEANRIHNELMNNFTIRSGMVDEEEKKEQDKS